MSVGLISRMESKIGTAVCRTARTVVCYANFHFMRTSYRLYMLQADIGNEKFALKYGVRNQKVHQYPPHSSFAE